MFIGKLLFIVLLDYECVILYNNDDDDDGCSKFMAFSSSLRHPKIENLKIALNH